MQITDPIADPVSYTHLDVYNRQVESDGYQAVQLGFGEVSANKVNKAAAGHFKKANVAPKKTLREFRLDDVSAMNVGEDVYKRQGLPRRNWQSTGITPACWWTAAAMCAGCW